MLLLALCLTCLMFAVMIWDLTRYLIPNWLVLATLALYPVLYWLAPVKPDWTIALLIALLAFGGGFLLFALRVMGGGDVKLLAVCALYAGKQAAPELMMGTALLGGVLAVALLLLRPFTAYLFSRLKNPPRIPRLLTIGEPVPYGLAIATAFLLILWMGKIPGLAL